jgi:addiction module HigA family antidote
MSSNVMNQYHPESVTAPGEFLQERLEELGMSQTEFAERIGRTKKFVNEVVKGKAAILPETALQFERALGMPARFWMNAESLYRESLARQSEREELKRNAAWLEKIPVKKMAQMGWVRKCADPVATMTEVLNFFGAGTPEALENLMDHRCLAFRQSAVHRADPYAVLAWLRKGELEAQRIQTAAYSKAAFVEALEELRRAKAKPIADVIEKMPAVCAKAGVAVVFVPEIPGARVWGVTQWVNAERAILQLSLRGKTDDVLWFTFFHEAAHILLHPKKSIFVETASNEDSWEEEADRFAAEALIPANAWRLVTLHRPKSREEVRLMAARIGIAPGILVGRMQKEGLLPWTHLNDLKVRVESAAGHGVAAG